MLSIFNFNGLDLKKQYILQCKDDKRLVYCERFDLLKQTRSVNGQWKKNVQFNRTFRKEMILLIGFFSLVHNLLDKCALAIAVFCTFVKNQNNGVI